MAKIIKCDWCGRETEVGGISQYGNELVCSACLWRKFIGIGGGLDVAQIMGNKCKPLTADNGKEASDDTR